MATRLMPSPIYLDNNATTPVDPQVLEAMLPHFTTRFGNPSNTTHSFGRDAADAVELARGQVAALIGAAPKEIVFTSGGTESNNLAVLGVARGARPRCDHVVTSAIEHKAVLEACRQLEREGGRLTYLPVDRFGMVAVADVDRAVTAETALVTVMAANNEVGTLNPVSEIGAVCRERGVLFHSDAVQAAGRIPVDVNEWGVDFLSLSAHKLYGPKGVGALFMRGGVGGMPLAPLVHGGGQEGGVRSGTPPVPLIVGFGVACEIARARLADEARRLSRLSGRLRELLLQAIPNGVVHGHNERSLPGLLSIGFPGVDGDVVLQLLTEVAVSQGSACSSGGFEPSHVLRAMKVPEDLISATLRLGAGRFTSASDVEAAAASIADAVKAAKAAV